MKLRNTLNGYEYEAALTTDHAASSYGQAVLVDLATGDAVDTFSFGLAFLLEATEEERAALRQAGYPA